MAGVSVGASVGTGGASAVAMGAKALSNVKAAALLASTQGQGGVIGTAKTLASAYSRAQEMRSGPKPACCAPKPKPSARTKTYRSERHGNQIQTGPHCG